MPGIGGNSLFIVLDLFWYTAGRAKTEGDHWHQTLGKDQYQWLAKTLTESKAQFKFVFIHHLVGGADRNNRGIHDSATSAVPRNMVTMVKSAAVPAI